MLVTSRGTCGGSSILFNDITDYFIISIAHSFVCGMHFETIFCSSSKFGLLIDYHHIDLILFNFSRPLHFHPMYCCLNWCEDYFNINHKLNRSMKC